MANLHVSGKLAAFAGALFLLALTQVHTAQGQENKRAIVSMNAADKEAASQVSNTFRVATPPHSSLAKSAGRKAALSVRPAFKKQNAAGFSQQGNVRFPGDLTYLGGPVVEFAESHAIFLLPNGQCPVAQCWGDPEGFLRDVSSSNFIHLVDQYVGLNANRRYDLGGGASLSYSPPATPLTDLDMLAVVHAVASASGNSGYSHIFHVFLPPGQDECFDSTFSVCYSPDNPASFFFCAYHGSVDFKDIGHVLYSVEPFQNVPGCQLRPGTPNGQLADSTNSTLSHELIETITDPDGNAWFNISDDVLLGEEIADECAFVFFTPTNAFGDPFVFRIGGKPYATQPEYSNELHACSIH